MPIPFSSSQDAGTMDMSNQSVFSCFFLFFACSPCWSYPGPGVSLFQIHPFLERSILQRDDDAASGGTDSGVMDLVGRAMHRLLRIKRRAVSFQPKVRQEGRQVKSC